MRAGSGRLGFIENGAQCFLYIKVTGSLWPPNGNVFFVVVVLFLLFLFCFVLFCFSFAVNNRVIFTLPFQDRQYLILFPNVFGAFVFSLGWILCEGKSEAA